MPCSNAAKTRNPLKFAGVPQTTGWISAVSRPKFTILWSRVEDISLLNNFFSDCRYVPWLRSYSPTKLCDGAQMAIFGDFLRPVFSASLVQQASDLHLKFRTKATRYPVKTSRCQNVPQSKRPKSKRPVFEPKRPCWSKRPQVKRTIIVNGLM